MTSRAKCARVNLSGLGVASWAHGPARMGAIRAATPNVAPITIDYSCLARYVNLKRPEPITPLIKERPEGHLDMLTVDFGFLWPIRGDRGSTVSAD